MGCTHLPRTTASVGSASATVTDVISQVATQTMGDVNESTMQVWSMPQPLSQHMQGNIGNTDKMTIQDINQNPVFAHVDQFGNPVRVQAAVET